MDLVTFTEETVNGKRHFFVERGDQVKNQKFIYRVNYMIRSEKQKHYQNYYTLFFFFYYFFIGTEKERERERE